MKKSIVALAVLAASGASFAQSSVTLYGIADIWFGQTSSTGLPSQTVLDSGGLSGSRWGLQGSEDLGGGLKANFLLEKGFTLDDGKETGSGFDRQAYVGFSGGFGEVKLGNVYTAYDDISASANAAFDSKLAPVTKVWLSTGYTSNPNNNIYYSFSAGAISGAVSYALGENKTNAASTGGLVGDGSASAVTSLNVQYADGPIYAGLGYQTDAPQGGGNSTDYTRLNGTYDFGAAKLLVGWGKVATGANSTSEWELGADVPVSAALTLSGGFARSSDNAAKGDATRKGYGFAAAYSLSKRTTAYAGFQSATTSAPAVADSTTRTTAVGIKHTF